MKINQEYRLPTGQIQKEINNIKSTPSNFHELLKTQNEKIQTGQLQQLLTEIEKAGERLERSRNFRDLIKYKNLVQSYLKEAVDASLELKQSNTWDQYGQNRILKIIKQIDEKLMQLTDEFFQKENDKIQILTIIGEIKGLLINLYT